MIALTPLLMALILALAALLVARAPEARSARRLGTAFAIAALALAVLLTTADALTSAPRDLVHGLAMSLSPGRALHLMPIVAGMVGLLALAMSPAETHPPRTLARTLQLLAIASASLSTSRPALLVALWAASSATAWAELRDLAAADRSGRSHRGDRTERAARPDRLFAAYHLPSVALVAVGVTLISTGSRTTGATLLVLGFAIRAAVFPAHSWFPLFVERAPMGLVIAFAVPQLGIYAQFAHLTDASQGLPAELAHLIPAIVAVSAVCAAALGVVQENAYRALAYLTMSQTAMVTFGLANPSPVARSGAMLAFQVLSLALSGFAMTLTALEARRGTLSLRAPGGSFARTPRLAAAFLVLGLATVGFPLTAGFVAEDLLVQGAVEASPLLDIFVIAASALNGIAVMRAFFMLFAGKRPHVGEQDLTRRETYALTVAMAALLVFGVLPRALIETDAGDSGVREDPGAHGAEHR